MESDVTKCGKNRVYAEDDRHRDRNGIDLLAGYRPRRHRAPDRRRLHERLLAAAAAADSEARAVAVRGGRARDDLPARGVGLAARIRPARGSLASARPADRRSDHHRRDAQPDRRGADDGVAGGGVDRGRPRRRDVPSAGRDDGAPARRRAAQPRDVDLHRRRHDRLRAVAAAVLDGRPRSTAKRPPSG